MFHLTTSAFVTSFLATNMADSKDLGMTTQKRHRQIQEDTSHTKCVGSFPHTVISRRSLQVTEQPRKKTHLRDPSTKQFSHVETTKHELTQPAEAEGVEVVYTKNVHEAETWLRTHITDCSASAVGFDMEWKPQFVSKKRGGIENKTAVLQLGVDTSCLVLHLHHMNKLPNLLVSILKDATVLKVGSAIKQDVSKLRRDRGLVCYGIVDTQDVAKSHSSSTQKVGLKALAERFLGITLAKSKRVTRSNWENFPLTLEQIEYAALDAWIGLKVYKAMEQRGLISSDIINEAKRLRLTRLINFYLIWFVVLYCLFVFFWSKQIKPIKMDEGGTEALKRRVYSQASRTYFTFCNVLIITQENIHQIIR